MTNNREIHVGRDYFDRIDGNAHVNTGATIINYYDSILNNLSPLSPKADILKLFPLIQQELAKLSLSDKVKEVTTKEVKEAEIQIRNELPDKKGMVQKLKNVANTLKATQSVGKEFLGLGKLIGKAIEWGGEQWQGLMT